MPPTIPAARIVYRLVLDSTSKISGTWNNATFVVNQLRDPPISAKDKLYVSVESFIIDNGANATTNQVPTRYMIVAPTLPFTNPSFYSGTNNDLNVLLTTHNTYQNVVSTNLMGHQLNSDLANVVRTKQHVIQIIDPATGALYAVPDPLDIPPSWALTLVFFSRAS